jgi:sugar phosphate isomerase/epimerase
MQQLLFLQSMWAMLRRHSDGKERTLEQNIEMIAAVGYDGISMPFFDHAEVRRAATLIEPDGLVMEGVCFPKSVEELEPALELATQVGVHHLDVQPNVRPRRLEDCIALLEGWRSLAAQASFPVYFETHRDRMTTDLYFTLDLLECFPDLKLVADLSHYLVGREFAYPVSDENHALIHKILDHSWALHGRVASREQVQVEISFPQHKIWLDLFLDWWR